MACVTFLIRGRRRNEPSQGAYRGPGFSADLRTQELVLHTGGRSSRGRWRGSYDWAWSNGGPRGRIRLRQKRDCPLDNSTPPDTPRQICRWNNLVQRQGSPDVIWRRDE